MQIVKCKNNFKIYLVLNILTFKIITQSHLAGCLKISNIKSYGKTEKIK